MKSLKSRLNYGLTSIIIIFLLLQWLVFSIFLKYMTGKYVESRLEHDIEVLVLALEYKSNVFILHSDKINPSFHKSFSGHYYQIKAGALTFYSASLWNKRLPDIFLKPGETKISETTGPQNKEMLVLSKAFSKAGNNITITVAEDISGLFEELKYFSLIYGFFSLLFLFSILVSQHLIIKRTLKPLSGLSQEMLLIGENKINNLSENVPLEIKPLVKEFNKLLSVLERRLEYSRNSLANLTHALKMPLSVVFQILEKDRVSEYEKSDIFNQLSKINNLIERELKRGRVAGFTFYSQKIQLNAEILPLISLMNQIYHYKKIKAQVLIPDNCIFQGDREDILELLGNIIDNAFKWADSAVKLEIIYKNKQLNIIIEDDGPGVLPEDISVISQRGKRFDESVPGHGFGLSISQEIVSLYGGKIIFGNSELLGGFKVIIELPV